MSQVDLSDPILYALVEARIKLLFSKPFIGNLASRLILLEVPWCGTAATDGRHFYYNREFIKSLSKTELLFLFGHEVLHCVFDHIGRRGHRDAKVYNMACDYLINWVLVNDSIGTMPKSGLYDKRFTDEMTSDEIYDILMSESVTIKMPLDEHLDAYSDDEDEEDGDGDQDGDGDGDGDGDEGEGSGKGKKKGKGNGKETEVRVMGKNGPPKLSKEDIEKIRNEVRAATLAAAQAAGAGNVPAGIRRMIESLIAPKMSWKELLDTHIRSAIKDDYTFQRPSRRNYGGFIMPGQNFQDTIDITCAIDCSGSMTQEMLRGFLSEVKGIMDTFRDFKLKLFVFDTEVYNFKEFTPENGDEITEYPMAGGGGTSFECCFEFMKREGIEPHRFVMFTDGYPNGSWGDPMYCDTLFVIYGDTHQHITAPFGQTAYYDD